LVARFSWVFSNHTVTKAVGVFVRFFRAPLQWEQLVFLPGTRLETWPLLRELLCMATVSLCLINGDTGS
jgi:hypothetical protein